jgi:hypothetical protein
MVLRRCSLHRLLGRWRLGHKDSRYTKRRRIPCRPTLLYVEVNNFDRLYEYGGYNVFMMRTSLYMSYRFQNFAFR